MVKHLKVVGHCLSELNDTGSRNLEPALSFQTWALDQLLMLISVRAAAVRQEVASCMVQLVAPGLDDACKGTP